MSFLSKLKSPLLKRFQKDANDSSNHHHQYDYNSDQSTTRSVTVYHIDANDNEGTVSIVVNNNDDGEVLLNRVCDHYSLNDYKEYFGLKYTLTDDKGNHEILWLNPLKSIGKQLKHSNNTLTFRVKHFPAIPHKIESSDVRYLIFLQLKTQLQRGELQLPINDEILLASYVVQSEYGDYDEILNKKENNYLKDKKFTSKKSDKIDEAIIDLHKKHIGLKPEDAELKFLEHVSQFNTYGAEILIVKNRQAVLVNFGVSHRGIISYLYGTPASAARIELYPWSQIGKISYENRSLYIHAHTPEVTNSEIIRKHTMVFKCNSERMCKHLWKFILEQRAFFTFNRGSDVPKLRSSKRIFGRTSKFRYSGRCEHEILVSQNDTSHNTSFNTSSVYNSLHRRPMKHFKSTSSTANNDKSFTDSGLSENYAETLPKLDETSSTKATTNSIITTTGNNTTNEQQHQDIDIKNQQLEIDTNQNDNNNNNNHNITPPPTTNNIELPTATSTPQLKIIKTEPIDLNEQHQSIDQITTTGGEGSSSSLLTTKSALDSYNEYMRNGGVNSSSTKTININRKKTTSNLKIVVLLCVIAIFFLIILLYLIPSSTTGNLYSTVKRFLKTTSNSVSLSITDNLRNSQLLFDPIFSFFLRNYEN